MRQAMSVTDNDSVLVELRPFAHQVGGHSCVLEINSSTICKPFVSKEAWFYENEPEEMKEYTPRYLGQVDVQCDTSSSSKCLIACLPCVVAKERGLLTFDPPSFADPCCKRTRKQTLDLTNSLIQSHTSQPSGNDTEPSENRDQFGLDVWSIQCFERQINRYGFWANNKPQNLPIQKVNNSVGHAGGKMILQYSTKNEFIMLENLVSKYEKPCMLDLKMGRRQYGDDSSSEKRKLLEDRCAKSTSSSLGFRICGAQVFQETTQSYTVHNKYHGRGLTVDGVKSELQFFFSNGTCLRQDVICQTIRKLQRLQALLKTQSMFSFYSCSLLLMYDSISSAEDMDPISSSTSCVGKEPYSGHVMDERFSEQLAETERSAKVDVRLIDFAHVSKRPVHDVRNSADDDILYGLENLISMLTSILQT